MQVTELWVELQDKYDLSPSEAQHRIEETMLGKDSLELSLFISSFKYIDDAYRWIKNGKNKKKGK
jgi:hypothetical protein|tara:strand:+ start:893 stop:1087 length:195 start_codon:yes stop_codon:yes gene_type:complete